MISDWTKRFGSCAALALGPISLLIVDSASAQAAGAPKVNYTAFSDEQLAAELAANLEADSTDWCGEMEPLTRQMKTRGTFDRRVDVLALYSDMVCAADEDRWDDARNRMTLYEQKWRQEVPFPLSVVILQKAGDVDQAEVRFLTFIDAAAPGEITREQSNFVWEFSRARAKAKQPERRIALFRQFAQPTRVKKFDMLTAEGIESALFKWEVEAGNIDAARALLPKLKSPDTVMETLGDRRFAELWPEIETLAGQNMAKVINALVDQRQTWLNADRNNEEALKALAEAYLYAGRFDDVLQLVSSREPAPDAYDALTEDMTWALSAKIRALDALGRFEEASAIYDRIAALDPGQDRGWIVNFVINRAIRLVSLGQSERGLAAAERAGEIAAEYGNDYARMLVRRSRICALAGMGKLAEAQALLADATEHSADSPSSAVQAMLCAGADDEAAKTVRKMLDDPVQVGEIIERLQSPDFTLYAVDSVLPNMATKLRRRADVAPVFLKVARDIPLDFVPLFTLRRTEQRAPSKTP